MRRWFLVAGLLVGCRGAFAQGTAGPAAGAVANGTVAAPQPMENKGLFARLAEFYREDWAGTTAAGPAAPRRGLESPLSSPPFPSANGPIAPETGTNGANCEPGLLRCFAPEWAMENYINRQLSPHDYLSLRSDFLNDKKGQRTGYAGRYTEGTLSWNHWIGSTVQLRPEVRFDHAFDRPAYDKGTRWNQFTAASDLVFHF